MEWSSPAPARFLGPPPPHGRGGAAGGNPAAIEELLPDPSHELRALLAKIKGAASTLADSISLPGDQATLVAELEKAAEELTEMVEEMITQADADRGRFSVRFEELDVGTVVQEGAREAAARYPIPLQVAVPPVLRGVADARALRGVVRALVDNACRHSEECGVVTVTARRGDEGIQVHVTDRSVPVRRDRVPAALQSSFSPGERVHAKERAGLWQGLSLARRLVALHGGVLWAEPLPGGGSRVSFTIPPEGPPDAVQADRADHEDAAPAADATTSS